MHPHRRNPKSALHRLRPSSWMDGSPPRFQAEANLLLSAMVPRCPVWLFLADHDRASRLVPLDDLLPCLRRQIHAVTGGDTTIGCDPWNRRATLDGDGRYVAANGTTMQETSHVLLFCLPPILVDRQREQLLKIISEFGLTTNQEVVQVIAGMTTCWLPTGELIDVRTGARERDVEVKLKVG